MQIPYHDAVKNYTKAGLKFFRQQIAVYAINNGIKTAAREFQCSKNTVKLWKQRYLTMKECVEISKKPKQSPNEMDILSKLKIQHESEKSIAAGKRIHIGILKQKTNIKYSEKTIRNTLRKLGLFKTRKKKWIRKRDLSELKKKYRPFEKIQVDLKELDDMPEFHRELVSFKLPRYQFTARCLRTGATFISFSYQKTIHNAIAFITYVLLNLELQNIKVRVVQTDHGTEFIQSWQHPELSEFTKRVKMFKTEHRLIPVGAKTYQSDVETFHRLIEDEFYTVEIFDSFRDFFVKAQRYINVFNRDRPNENKNNQSPYEIALKYLNKSKLKVLSLEPIILDEHWKEFFFLKRSA